MELEILITVYNEGNRLEAVVAGIQRELSTKNLEYCITILNDGSTDWSMEREKRLTSGHFVKVIHFDANRGKGAVLNAVLSRLKGTVTVVIDADYEYDPSDIESVVKPLFQNKADWVLGSRYGFGRRRPKQYFLTFMANRFFNALFNLLSGLNLNDLLSGLFAFRTEMVQGIALEQQRFSFTPEMTWKVERSHHPRWLEVPISYRFRTYSEGKKIAWWEFFTVTWAILWYRFERI